MPTTSDYDAEVDLIKEICRTHTVLNRDKMHTQNSILARYGSYDRILEGLGTEQDK